jgi:hypothetical protein
MSTMHRCPTADGLDEHRRPVVAKRREFGDAASAIPANIVSAGLWSASRALCSAGRAGDLTAL